MVGSLGTASKSLRCGSAQGGNNHPNAGRFWRVEKLENVAADKGLHSNPEFSQRTAAAIACLGLHDMYRKYCGGPLCKGTFSAGFSGLVNEPAKPSKTVGHSIETISTGVAFCSYGYCRNHVGTLNGAISSILGAGHGMAERDAAGCPSKSVACPRAWVLIRLQNLYTVCRHLRAAS